MFEFDTSDMQRRGLEALLRDKQQSRRMTLMPIRTHTLTNKPPSSDSMVKDIYAEHAFAKSSTESKEWTGRDPWSVVSQDSIHVTTVTRKERREPSIGEVTLSEATPS